MTEGTPDKIDALTERLSAYVDGEVSAEEARDIESVLARNATARRIVAELRSLSERVGSLPVERSPNDMKERVLAALERDALLDADGIDPVNSAHSGWRVFQLLASAALVAIAVGVGYFIYLTMGDPSAVSGGGETQIARLDEQRGEPPLPMASTSAETDRDETHGDAFRGRRADPQPPAPTAASSGEPAALADRAQEGEERLGALEDESLAMRHSARESASTTGRAIDSPAMTVEPPADLAFDASSAESSLIESAEPISPEILTGQRLDQVENQLTFAFADADSVHRVTDRVQRYLESNALVDAERLPSNVQLANSQQLYIQNNAAPADPSPLNQILIRANPSVISALVDELEAEGSGVLVQQSGAIRLYPFDENAARLSRTAGQWMAKAATVAGEQRDSAGIDERLNESQSAGGDESTATSDDEPVATAAEPVPDTGAMGLGDAAMTAVPGSAGTQTANTPVKVGERADPAAESERRGAREKDSSGDERKVEPAAIADTQPSKPMRQLRPALEEQPVLVLLNFALRQPTTQATTAPMTPNP